MYKETVFHFGPFFPQTGGIAAVLAEYQTSSEIASSVKIIATTRYMRDPLAIIYYMRALFTVLRLKARAASPHMVFHVSQGGSFVREGSLILLSNLLQLKPIVHIHGSNFVDFASRRSWLVRAVLVRASKILVLTEPTREMVISLTNGSESSIHKINNSIDTFCEVSTQSNKIVMFGGVCSQAKGLDTVLRVWSSLEPTLREGWTLRVAGAPADVTIPSGESVQYLGNLERGDFLTAMSNASILFHPSRFEAQPMVVLEAMARGLAPLTSTVGDLPVVLSGGAGIIHDSEDADEFAASLSRLMSDVPFRRATANNARNRAVDSYSKPAVLRQLEHIWLSN